MALSFCFFVKRNKDCFIWQLNELCISQESKGHLKITVMSTLCKCGLANDTLKKSENEQTHWVIGIHFASVSFSRWVYFKALLSPLGFQTDKSIFSSSEI